MDWRTFRLRALIVCLFPLAAWCWTAQPAARAQDPPASGVQEPPVLAVQGKDQPPDKKDQKDKEPPPKLPIEKLLDTPVVPSTSASPLSPQQVVTSVSRQESTVAHSPAAVFVITQEMIRRSGATSLPQLFRMVPGMDVARVDSSRWAISARGFNSRFSDKLLVQIDGRAIYQPIFSGVFWEAQDLVLQDIERIEVIRGPGATVWGQNAVNGVINVITKRSQDTLGGLLTGGGGTQAQATGAFRYGDKIGEDLYYRVWGKGFQGGTFVNQAGRGFDDWRQGRGGFRSDWQATSQDAATFQGEYFQGNFGRTDIRSSPIGPAFQTARVGDEKTRGGNLVGTWRHEIGEKSDWTLQAYFDNFRRDITNGFARFDFNTYVVDFQQQFPLTDRQQIVYGLGYRLDDNHASGSNFDNGFTIFTTIEGRQFSYASAFLQDEFTLVPEHLFFTAGCKFLQNNLTGFEYQPTARLLYALDKTHSVWSAVSRAVRTPNYADQYVVNTTLPTFPTALRGAPLFGRSIGNTDVISEDAIAYEVGYRAQPSERFSWDVAGFFNVYDNLITTRPGTRVAGSLPGTFIQPAPRTNGVTGESWGVELAASTQVTESWRLYGNYTFLDLRLHPARGLGSLEAVEGQSPRNQVYLQSSWDVSRNLEFDVFARYVDVLPGFASPVPAYTSLDVRLAWRPRPNLELAIVGQNLLSPSHLELGTSARAPFPLLEVPRGVFASMTLNW